MSLYDYRRSSRLAYPDESFAALIMAAMRRADTPNYERLRNAFPAIEAELRARYKAPGGILDGDGLGNST